MTAVEQNRPVGQSRPNYLGEQMTKSRVLIVDDEPDILDEMGEMLETEGIFCFRASNADEALTILRTEEDLDAIVTDIRMPGMSGLELTRTLKLDKESTGLLSIVILTGHAGFDEAVEALQAGAEDFLSKPIDPERLIHSVGKAVELTRLRRTEQKYQSFLAGEVQAGSSKNYELERSVAEKERELFLERQNLAAASRAREEFFELISHELRTPLILIQSLAARLAENAGPGTDTADDTDFIERAAADALKYLDAVLSLSAFDVASADGENQDGSTLIAEVFDTLENATGNRMRQKGLRIRQNITEGLSIRGQGKRLAQALNFLLEESIADSDEGKNIYLSARADDDALTITIARTGDPIKDLHLDLMTKSFEDFDLETIRDGSIGERLNLPLARIFVENYAGRIEAANEADRGSTISVVLPHNVIAE